MFIFNVYQTWTNSIKTQSEIQSLPKNVWLTLKKVKILSNHVNYTYTYPWEYTLEMLMVPPSTVKSCSFGLSLVVPPSVGHDLSWHSGWGWDEMFSASDANLGGSWGTAPLILTGVKTFGCSDIGKGIPLLVIMGWLSICLKVVAVLMSDSTGFCALPAMVGETQIFFSSNFPANTNAGADALFTPRDWST